MQEIVARHGRDLEGNIASRSASAGKLEKGSATVFNNST